MLINAKQVERDLKELIDAGSSLGDALRTLHHRRGLGHMFLWPAVMSIQQIGKEEAMLLVIRETGENH